MDKVDEEINELVASGCCISSPKHLERLSEGYKMWAMCAMCQTAKTGEGFDKIPPGEDWIDNDDECRDCEVVKWFRKHA
jgi:hypothetical protein